MQPMTYKEAEAYASEHDVYKFSFVHPVDGKVTGIMYMGRLHVPRRERKQEN